MLFLLLFFSSAVLAKDVNLPTPPKGYKWAKCPEIKGAFLRPHGWHFKKSKQGSTLGFFITKENISKNGQFMTGLTVNVIPDIPKKQSMSPYEYARVYRETTRKSEKITQEWNKDMGPFRSVGFVFDKKDKAGDFRVHNLLIANDNTGTLYLVMFEAPISEWNKAWKIAEPMLQYLLIDDTV